MKGLARIQEGFRITLVMGERETSKYDYLGKSNKRSILKSEN